MNDFFDIRLCGVGELAAVRAVEAEVLASLERPDQLRRNSEEMWRTCLQPPHLCLGAWSGGELVAVAVLYVPSEGDWEALGLLVQSVGTEGLRTANFKICIVRPEWRGHGLQVRLGQRLHEEARKQGIGLLCATASPYNGASIRSLEKLGYRADRRLTKYGFERVLFYCFV